MEVQLVQKIIIKKGNLFFSECDNLCWNSKNLYNSGLFYTRKQFFAKEQFPTGYDLVNKFSKENNSDYRKLPSKVSQQTLFLVYQNFKSFFGLLKSSKVDKKNAKLPKYLDKTKGRFITIFNKQAISFKEKGSIKLSKTNIKISTILTNINQVRIVPKGSYYVIEILYKVNSKPLIGGEAIASIDLGVNNLATVSSNVFKPFIINGRPLKSINQFYNKEKASLQSKLPKGKYKSNRTSKLDFKRNNKINDYLHKASRKLINHLVSNNISKLVIGKNANWKQEVNLGKKNNQNFVQIPFNKFIQMLKYKGELEGIEIFLQEESYTSKCSFLDNEDICFHKDYKGKRIKRGLFQSSNKLINADLNGSLNILKKFLKVVSNKEFSLNEIEGLIVNPVILNIPFH